MCMQLRRLCEAPPVDPAVTPYQDDACAPEQDSDSKREGQTGYQPSPYDKDW